jgi:hypothetical protein
MHTTADTITIVTDYLHSWGLIARWPRQTPDALFTGHVKSIAPWPRGTTLQARVDHQHRRGAPAAAATGERDRSSTHGRSAPARPALFGRTWPTTAPGNGSAPAEPRPTATTNSTGSRWWVRSRRTAGDHRRTRPGRRSADPRTTAPGPRRPPLPAYRHHPPPVRRPGRAPSHLGGGSAVHRTTPTRDGGHRRQRSPRPRRPWPHARRDSKHAPHRHRTIRPRFVSLSDA